MKLTRLFAIPLAALLLTSCTTSGRGGGGGGGGGGSYTPGEIENGAYDGYYANQHRYSHEVAECAMDGVEPCDPIHHRFSHFFCSSYLFFYLFSICFSSGCPGRSGIS